MRYYVIAIQHNWEANAENRTAPKAFDTKNEALAEFHTQIGKDIKNATLDWSLAMIINSDGGVEDAERYWGPEKVPAPEPEVVEEPTEEPAAEEPAEEPAEEEPKAE